MVNESSDTGCTKGTHVPTLRSVRGRDGTFDKLELGYCFIGYVGVVRIPF